MLWTIAFFIVCILTFTSQAFLVSQPQRPTTTTTTTTTSWQLSATGDNDDDDDDNDNDTDLLNFPPGPGGVTLKLALDSQWAVAEMASEKSERFTCEESLDMVHRLRRCSDAVLVGRSTVVADDCSLTVRRVKTKQHQQQPIRVILDPFLQLETTLQDYQIATDGLPTIILHSDTKSRVTKESQFPNVQYVAVPPLHQDERKLSMQYATEILRSKYGIHHLMVEGGPSTAISFLNEGLVDRAILVHAPMAFTDPFPSHMTPKTLEDAGLELLGEQNLGADRATYWSKRGVPWPSSPNFSWP